jgi:hypothetical protein
MSVSWEDCDTASSTSDAMSSNRKQVRLAARKQLKWGHKSKHTLWVFWAYRGNIIICRPNPSLQKTFDIYCISYVILLLYTFDRSRLRAKTVTSRLHVSPFEHAPIVHSNPFSVPAEISLTPTSPSTCLVCRSSRRWNWDKSATESNSIFTGLDLEAVS